MAILSETPELLGLVMEAVTLFPKVLKRETLLACSRVNRCFSQEALRMLWSELNSLYPLMCLFPEDAASISITRRKKWGFVTATQVYQRELRVSDWDRILHYTPFVRILRSHGSLVYYHYFGESELEFLMLYSTFFPDSFIFPGLLLLEGFNLKAPSVLTLLPPTLLRIKAHLIHDMQPNVKTLVLERISSIESLKRISLSSNPSIFLPHAFLGSPQETLHVTKLTLYDYITLEQFTLFEATIVDIDDITILYGTKMRVGNASVALSFLPRKGWDLAGPLHGCVHAIQSLGIRPSEVFSVSVSLNHCADGTPNPSSQAEKGHGVLSGSSSFAFMKPKNWRETMTDQHLFQD